MFLYDHFAVNQQGNITMDGVDLGAIAQEFGTPTYVVSHQYIVEKCRSYHKIMGSLYEQYAIAYASKALSAKFMYRILKDEHMHIDVVSGGEIHTALAAGFPAHLLHFNGGNKSPFEVEYALKNGVENFVIDNFDEIDLIGKLADTLDKHPRVFLRIKPCVDAHTHVFISTGLVDSKFGFGIEDGQADQAVERVLGHGNMTLTGLHCHIGSQLFLDEPYLVTGRVMVDYMAHIREKFQITLPQLIMGGGFGIKYTYEDEPKSPESMMRAGAQGIKEACETHHFPVPAVTIEPGRSIVGPAGVTLYRVGNVREIPHVRNYVSIDGGMTDNPRYALYEAKYEASVVSKGGQPREYLATIGGKCCESGDLISKDVLMQKPQYGDVLVVFSTGAYNYSMASNYNKNPRPAMVLVKDNKTELVIRRESYDDLIKNEL